MPKDDFGHDNCPLCLLMRKADEINRLSMRRNGTGKGFRALGDVLDDKGFNKR